MATVVDRVASFLSGPAAAPPPGSNYNADGDGVYIEPLEGLGLLQLVGYDTPKQGVIEGASLRSVTTRYPGNDRPSTQILGVEEKPYILEGTFRDDLTGIDGHAMAQRNAMRAALIARSYSQLSWGTAIVRRGYIKDVEFDVKSERWIGYKLTFEVSEADEAATVAKPFPTPETPFDLLAVLRDVADAVSDAADAAILVNNVVRAIA